MMEEQLPKSVVMVAGEASGDLHGAHVIEALHRRNKAICVCGAGAAAMKRAGAKIIVNADELSVMGFTAVFAKAPQILKALLRLKRLIASTKPDLLILIDFPDFNLHLAGYAKNRGVPVLYYISPTVWAWRPKRIEKIKKRVDHMAVILPFEKALYDRHDVPATYVGHPLLDDVVNQAKVGRPGAGANGQCIALLPGSRRQEVQRLLPEMLQAAKILQNYNKNLRFILSCAPSIDHSIIYDLTAASALKNFEIVREPASNIFARSNLAVVASGTASLEAAIYGIPAIIIYQVSAFSYWIAEKLVEVPHIGLANLIAGERIFPELVQEAVTAENVAHAAHGLLTDPAAYGKMLSGIERVQQRLGKAGASDRVADIACRLMGGCHAV
jgi:lipid-A-disaccharide synthase